VRTATALLTAGLVAVPSMAWAHGELRPDRVPAGTTAQVDLFLPSERDGARTTKVVLAMPEGFTARTCQEPVGWTCSVTADAVRWQDVARVRAESHFFFTMTVATRGGTYTLPVEQTYDDGTVSTFAGRPGTPDEAPVLTVTTSGQASPTAPPPPPPSSSAPAPSGSGRPRTTAPGATASATTGPTASAVVSATSAVPVPTGSFVRPSTLPRGTLVTAPEPAGGTSRVGPVLLAAALVVVGGVAVASRVAARRRPDPRV
jgi:uncharacterized protein YcnI